MKYRLVGLEVWPISEAEEIQLIANASEWFDAPIPGNAAKRVAELGGRGHCVLEDENGNQTRWELHAITIHYAYPA